jgi:phosphinothricin acetyltransferase
MESTDGMKILAIYAEAIKGAHATFDTNIPTWSEWDRAHLPMHRFVAVDGYGRKILGFTAASKVSDRREYAGVVECYTFVRADAQRAGAGTALLTALIEATEAQGVWTLQANVFPENAAALALHTKLGFRVVGTRERVGRHRGAWRDILLLERRSPTVL